MTTHGAPSNCTKCRLCAGATQPVNGQGRAEGIFVVASLPAYYDDRDNEPLVARQGKLFRLIAAEAGIPMHVVFKTYAVRCFSDGVKPKKDDIIACKEYLLREIAVERPRIIITLGKEALLSLYGFGRNLNQYSNDMAMWEAEVDLLVDSYQAELTLWSEMPRKGRPLKPKKPKAPSRPKKPKDENVTLASVAGHTLIQSDTGVPMIATYAPNFIMHGKWEYTDVVIQHFKKAMRIYTGEQGTPVG